MHEKAYVIIFFIILPSLYIPINVLNTQTEHFTSEYFRVTTTILGTVIVIPILGSAGYINRILRGQNLNASSYRNALNLRRYSIKAQLISAPSFIGIFVISVSLFALRDVVPQEFANIVFWLSYLWLPFAILSLILVAHIFICERGRNLDLRLTTAWIMSIETSMLDSEKMNRLMNCVKNYDEHLHTTMKRRLNNLEKIYSKIILDNSKNMMKVVDDVKGKLQDGDLSLTSYLQEYLDKENSDTILIKQSRLNQIKENMNLIKSIVSTTLIILAFILQQSGILKLPK